MQMQTTVCHAAPDGSDYVTGLREYFQYRDTGIRSTTGGAFTAHVIRAVPGKTVEPQWHSHKAGFQMFFVLNGWIEFEYEDIGRVRMEKGSSVYQPPGIRHRELRHSDDLEILEVVSPADFATDLEDEPRAGA
ncbi:MAG TPA: cupin domain-containing protein [Burkholderiaceae bacterium]|nr:cupin domain-containing protein [Burkholderiaceae bacterium]